MLWSTFWTRTSCFLCLAATIKGDLNYSKEVCIRNGLASRMLNVYAAPVYRAIAASSSDEAEASVHA